MSVFSRLAFSSQFYGSSARGPACRSRSPFFVQIRRNRAFADVSKMTRFAGDMLFGSDSLLAVSAFLAASPPMHA